MYRDEDSGDFAVQGYVVSDPADLAQMDIPSGETAVRVPASIFTYLSKDEPNGIS
ncbi:hypothetical protein [Streptomyces qinglanensis]|uniref:hypothetical protein n=1 Tax=Streptomyces qinglanensis TaxID=943816 RepID=UPI003D73BA08